MTGGSDRDGADGPSASGRHPDEDRASDPDGDPEGTKPPATASDDDPDSEGATASAADGDPERTKPPSTAGDGDPEAEASVDGPVDYDWVMQVTFVATVLVGAPLIAGLSVVVELPTWESRVGFAARIGALVWIVVALSVYGYDRWVREG